MLQYLVTVNRTQLIRRYNLATVYRYTGILWILQVLQGLVDKKIWRKTPPQMFLVRTTTEEGFYIFHHQSLNEMPSNFQPTILHITSVSDLHTMIDILKIGLNNLHSTALAEHTLTRLTQQLFLEPYGADARGEEVLYCYNWIRHASSGGQQLQSCPGNMH